MPSRFSINPVIDAGTETVWPNGGLWLPPTQARIHSIASGDANDTAAGTGARTVWVTGYTAAGASASEVVTLDGIAAVNTAAAYTHITDIVVLTAGSNGVNAGLLTATAATDSTVTCAVAIGHNRSSGCFLYSQDLGEQLEVTAVTLTHSNATAADLEALLVYRRAGETLLRKMPVAGTLDAGTTSITVPVSLIIETGGFVRLDVTSSAAGSRVVGALHFGKRA